MATSGAPTRKHGPTTSPGSTTYASARQHRETMLQRSPWVGISLRSSGLLAVPTPGIAGPTLRGDIPDFALLIRATCFFMRYARSALISQIFDLESTRAGADGTQARARLSHSKRP